MKRCLRGAFGGWGYEGNCGFAAKKCRGALGASVGFGAEPQKEVTECES